MIDLEQMAEEARRRLRERVNRSAAAHVRVMRRAFRKLRDIEPGMRDLKVVSDER